MNNTSYFCIPLRLCVFARLFFRKSLRTTPQILYSFAPSLRCVFARQFSENLCEQHLKFCIPLRLCVFARQFSEKTLRALRAFLLEFIFYNIPSIFQYLIPTKKVQITSYHFFTQHGNSIFRFPLQ